MQTNPLTNSNKLKLGVFHLNGNSGARTLVPERYRLSWDNVLAAVRRADAAGFEAIVPYSRWASETPDFRHQSAQTFETLTWAAAVGAATSYSSIMSTVHVMHMHPVYAAKAMATIDHVTRGRFALNVVCGWVPEDMRIFGHEDIGNEGRYAYADEWAQILKLLWAGDKPASFKGNYLAIDEAWSDPKPLQQPRPLMMNAGGSDQGKQFVGKHCDIAFIRTESHERMKAQAAAYRSYVKETHGRDIQIWIQGYVVQRNSYEEAQRYLENYAVDNADVEHVEAILKLRNRPLEGAEAISYRRNLGAGPGGLPVIGSPADIAETLTELADAGIDGVLMSWVDPISGIEQFSRDVMPLLEKKGLRAPVPTRTAA
ncbi:LLM class flavin-dependent oxidoreductase [Sinorhizobium mexicanum]|uniref:LLM class flavin-dependent oxidoreductase n=1 Tax=Sinorhizobium mexicanum TaxID=375549 RepID=A0A859QNS2_9HYPH|nr:LLM class flavin-dependent oxidoreductase [Sinorhizobium mexicanum]MBP1884366.1 alkanesulfonate monooxygenase SsuD/methylene tetrahydromethanopterin reductase-like flavin-dependent oxidoreductase (luciferase family) [Sinorhizobium mexicanum]QLL65045.1 LLM class flavin-dependent oxidoreductase [Sinorhizobium mexicanum]